MNLLTTIRLSTFFGNHTKYGGIPKMSLQRINNRGDSRATPASSKLFSTAAVASQRGRSFITSHLNLHTLINTRHEQHTTPCELSAHNGDRLSFASVQHRDTCDTRRILLEASVTAEPKVSRKRSPGVTSRQDAKEQPWVGDSLA